MELFLAMNLSYWEHKTWFKDIDFTIIGSGIVGLNCALALRDKYPKSKILILEKGILPSGASTKNAGFACYGSLSEILKDLEHQKEEEVFALVKKRVEGIQFLRNSLGDKAIDYQQYGGYELFTENNGEFSEACFSNRIKINAFLKPIFKKDTFTVVENPFHFKKIDNHLLFCPFEGQIDTGKMMHALLKKANKKNIFILNNTTLTKYSDNKNEVSLLLNDQFEMKTKKLFIATNGFARQLFKEDVQPARAQVLITKPIKNLKIKGTFHIDEGFYYFRNIDDRILFGGGRNLDFNTENTTELGLTNLIQQKLETLLKDSILPEIPFEIEHRWSGIMGIGNTKIPIVKPLSENVYCGVRLGGMGVAIGSVVGVELSNLA